MTLFPLEIYELIISQMALGDAARIARCSKSLYGAACRRLYKQVKLQFSSGIPDRPTKLLLQQLSMQSNLRHSIRHFSLCNKASTVWTSGHSTLASLLLAVVLEFPDRIRTFQWDAGGVLTSSMFFNLTSLQCGRVQSKAEIQWVQKHLTTCRGLRVLRLGLVSPPLPGIGAYLFSSVRSNQLQEVSLQRVDLTHVVPTGLLSQATRVLELRHCPGADMFLAQACRANFAKQLNGLVLVGNIALATVMEFVRHLSSSLQRLALCLGGAIQLPCIQCVTPNSLSLRSLVLDFRVNINSAEGSWMYHAADYMRLVHTYPKLETLSLPLDLRDMTKSTYTRAPLPILNAQSSRLQFVHLRRKCYDWRRAARDAKHVAHPFRGTRTMAVFIGHSASLRKLTFGKDTSLYESVSPAERQRLQVDIESLCALA